MQKGEKTGRERAKAQTVQSEGTPKQTKGIYRKYANSYARSALADLLGLCLYIPALSNADQKPVRGVDQPSWRVSDLIPAQLLGRQPSTPWEESMN